MPPKGKWDKKKKRKRAHIEIEDDKGNGNNYDDGHDEEDRQAYIEKPAMTRREPHEPFTRMLTSRKLVAAQRDQKPKLGVMRCDVGIYRIFFLWRVEKTGTQEAAWWMEAVRRLDPKSWRGGLLGEDQPRAQKPDSTKVLAEETEPLLEKPVETVVL